MAGVTKPNSGSFQKGNKAAVGNKGPGPRPRLISDAIRAKLNELDPKSRKKHLYKLIDKMFDLAYKGDVPMIKEINERAEGKVPSQATSEDGQDAVIRVIVEGGLPRKKAP